jgi:hypothetical protein
LPAAQTAFDGAAMRGYLQKALFDSAPASHTIEQCEPDQSIYTGECCVVRYQLTLKEHSSGEQLQSLATARIFQDRDAADRYMREKLAPLAARMRGREEVAPFATPVAAIEALNMVVYVFPIDGELPTLVECSDPLRMRSLLTEMLPDARSGRLSIQDCRVELGHYGRQHRCVLRYHILGAAAGDDTPRRALIYGKIAADGRGALAGPVIDALHARVLDRGGYQFNIPQSFGFQPDLQLALFEAIPGVPQVAQLLKARLKGEAPREDGMSLEESIDACARIAASLHTSGIDLGPRRAFEDELANLRAGFALVQPISPELGAQFQIWLDRVADYAANSQPLDLCFSHGDFSYTQLIFAGAQCGLVDFDTVCQAEPALDLGQFLAYIRMAARKGKAGADATSATIEQLCAQFLQTYITAAGDALEDVERVRLRASAYEIISLLRLALHSWQKLKGSRLEYVNSILEERVSCLP